MSIAHIVILTSSHNAFMKQCSKLKVHLAPTGVHILATGCTSLECVYPAGASFNIRIAYYVHIYMAGCMVFSGHAPSECIISDLNLEH